MRKTKRIARGRKVRNTVHKRRRASRNKLSRRGGGFGVPLGIKRNTSTAPKIPRPRTKTIKAKHQAPSQFPKGSPPIPRKPSPSAKPLLSLSKTPSSSNSDIAYPVKKKNRAKQLNKLKASINVSNMQKKLSPNSKKVNSERLKALNSSKPSTISGEIKGEIKAHTDALKKLLKI